MQDSKNKTGLFHFLADRIADMHTVDPVIVTKEDVVLSNHEIRLDDIYLHLSSHPCKSLACRNCGLLLVKDHI